MILRTETVEQVVDRERRVTLVKDVVMTPGATPLGMVRKRLPAPAVSRGTLLLIHGFGQNRYTFHSSGRSFSAFLAEQGWDVFNLDLRGHGRSRRFGSRRPDALTEYVTEDLPACAREALRLSGHDEAFLLGHSMGGILSYAAAATSLRQSTRGIISIGSPYHFGLGSRTLTALSALSSVVRYTGVLDGNARVPLRFVGHHLRRRRAWWDSRFLPMPIRAWAPGSTEDEILDEYLRTAFDWTSLAIAVDILRSKRGLLADGPGSAQYGAAFEWLDMPLLVIAGEKDKLAPVASVRPAYALSQSMDKSFRAFALGHIDLIVGREAPHTVWKSVAEWLAKR